MTFDVVCGVARDADLVTIWYHVTRSVPDNIAVLYCGNGTETGTGRRAATWRHTLRDRSCSHFWPLRKDLATSVIIFLAIITKNTKTQPPIKLIRYFRKQFLILKPPEHGLSINMGKNLNYP